MQWQHKQAAAATPIAWPSVGHLPLEADWTAAQLLQQKHQQLRLEFEHEVRWLSASWVTDMQHQQLQHQQQQQ